MKFVEGGICAPKGFQGAGVHCGIRGAGEKKDLSLIVSDLPATAAGVYTTNKVYGAPIVVTRNHIADGKATAIICNSGNANTCAPNGVQVAEETCRLTGEALQLPKEQVLVASTGVIGEPLSIEPFKRGIPKLVQELSYTGSDSAAQGIMTTDTIKKEVAVEFAVDGVLCRIGGIAKGSGMIHPNMATMLGFITSDVAIEAGVLQKVLSETVKKSFNQISVDGDTSTNDMVLALANGMAGNAIIEKDDENLAVFKDAFEKVACWLAKHMATDGEGAGKLITCKVARADTLTHARSISRSVISSDLLKAAVFGEDANWGRVLCAIGYAAGDFATDNIDVVMASEKGKVTVCKESGYAPHSEEEAAEILSADEIEILVDMHSGNEAATAWGCDLTYDYVKINGDYRS